MVSKDESKERINEESSVTESEMAAAADRKMAVTVAQTENKPKSEVDNSKHDLLQCNR